MTSESEDTKDRFGRGSVEDPLEDDPLRDHFVWWDEITTEEVDRFEEFLDTNPGERAIHRYLEQNRSLLVQPLSGGHGRYVISRTWLGRDAEIDFLVGERSSLGLSWLAVELKDSNLPLYTQADKPSASLRDAIQQISDFRIWLEQNLNYAENPKSKQGLGLTNIGSRPLGLILMSRRRLLRTGDDSRRREERRDRHIEIHTYDWLVDHARGRVASLVHTRD